MPWEPETPFLLPEIRALLLGGEEFETLSFLRPFELADSLLGVVHGLGEKALELLYEWDQNGGQKELLEAMKIFRDATVDPRREIFRVRGGPEIG